MPLKITHRKEQDVPQPTRPGRVNQDLEAVKLELEKLRKGMVLEIQTGSGKSVRATKMLVTRAGKAIGIPVRYWHDGNRVFVKATSGEKRRRKPPQ